MRLLVVFVLLAGCYDPEIDDCQFRCDQSQSCPDGASCDKGFCRTSAGTCVNDPCANAPSPPANCGNKFPLLDVDGCGVVCTSELTHDNVQFACGPSWRAGILDARAELDAVPVTTNRYWVGAQRVTTGYQWFTGAPIDPAAWDSNYPVTDNASSCVYLDGSKRRLRNDQSCENTEFYICTYPPLN